MAVKSNFTDGTALPASDINTYLTNGGLVYITGATIGTAVTAVNLTSVFSSTYDSYRVVFRTDSATGNSNFLMRFGTGTAVATNYKSYLYSNNAAWTTGGSVQVTDLTGALLTYGHPTSITGNADINGPNLARATTTFGQYATSDNGGFTAGIQTDSTQFTSLHLVPVSGTFTGGLVTVYGYRKA